MKTKHQLALLFFLLSPLLMAASQYGQKQDNNKPLKQWIVQFDDTKIDCTEEDMTEFLSKNLTAWQPLSIESIQGCRMIIRAPDDPSLYDKVVPELLYIEEDQKNYISPLL